MLAKLVSGIEVVLTPEEEAAQLAEWEANRIAITEERRIAGIKHEADIRIASLFPTPTLTDKTRVHECELNHIMLNAELDYIVLTGGVLDAEQQATKDAFVLIKDKIKDIRTMSNLAEVNGDTVDVYIAALDAKGYGYNP